MVVMVQGKITGKGAVKQQLFDEAYRPEDSRHFEVSASSTFKPDTSRQFDLAYADGTELKGFNAHDIVQVQHKRRTSERREQNRESRDRDR